MKITQSKSEGLQRVFDVVISAQEIANKLDQHLIQYGRETKIPGFRPGHAPLSILRTRFKGQVIRDVLGDFVDEGIKLAYSENDVRPATRPAVDTEQYEDDQDFKFKIDVEIMPEINPVDLKALNFERLKVEVGEKDIEKCLKDVAKNHVRMKPAAKTHMAKEGDSLQVGMQAFIKEEPFELHSHDDITLRLGSEQFDPQMHEALKGAKAGKDYSVVVSYPKDARLPEIAGKQVRYEIAIHEIQQPETVKVDDQLATEKGCKDLAELKEKIAEELGKHFDDASFWHVKRQVLDLLAEKHEFPVPQALLNQEIENIKSSGGLEDDAETADKKKSKKESEEEEQEIRQIAERRVRLGLLLAQIGNDNNIQVQQSEISGVLLERLRQFPGHEAEIIEMYQKQPELMAQIKAPILENKVVDFILEKAEVKETSIAPDAFEKEFAKISN